MTSPIPNAPATSTAGLRGSHWEANRLPAGVRMTAHSLRTQDGAVVNGYLFRRGGERTVCCAMHPGEMVVTSYLVPEILEAGCAMWVMGPRTIGNDVRLEHETAILDLAAGQCFLRDIGFECRVIAAISGGVPLAAFFVEQAATAPEQRIKATPAGRPVPLAEADLPSPHGFIMVSPHRGQGMIMLDMIDPAVVDEGDPLLTDESLSAFNPDNGWRPSPESACYNADFMLRYRVAQRRRVERIDAFAKAAVERKRQARLRRKQSGQRQDDILATWSPIFHVWRTDADPRCFDLSLDPSDRAYGSVWGPDPIVSNYGSIGFARVCTPESWLSNWSAFASNAALERCAPSITQPTLMIEYTGDNGVFPADADLMFRAVGSADKQREKILGNHQGRPVRPGQPNGQRLAGERIRAWLAAHSFT